jgi:hypothetical protein
VDKNVWKNNNNSEKETLVTMATAAILNFYNLPIAATHHGGYSYKVSRFLGDALIKLYETL